MGMCQCNKKEEEKEIKAEEKVENESNPAIINEFNLEEYENAILVENNVVDDKVTDLDTNFVKESNETTNRFNSRVLDLINKIRRDPPSYANTILENIQYISNENNKLIFKKKVKVLLNKGEEAFRNAAEELKKRHL